MEPAGGLTLSKETSNAHGRSLAPGRVRAYMDNHFEIVPEISLVIVRIS